MEQHPRRWPIVIMCLLIAGIVILGVWLSMRSSVPTVPPLESAPIITPDIESVEDIARLTQNKPLPKKERLDALPPIDEYDHVWNDDYDANVSIILYANLSNKFAALMLPSLQSYVEDPSVNANLIFRHYPLDGSESDLQAAMMGECVRLQSGESAFWSYLGYALGMQNASIESFATAAFSIGADPEAAITCVEEEKTWNYVLSQRQQAELRANFRVSPAIIVYNRATDDVRILEGANTVEYVRSVVDDTYFID
jgi:protein-disulfide isomerase